MTASNTAKRKPGRPAGTKAKVRAPLTLDALTVQQADQATMRAFRKSRGERDKEQRAIDTIVDSAHDKWVEAGRPSDWNARQGLFVRVPSGELDTLKWRVQRAAQFLGFRYRFGEVRHADGFAETVFTVTDKPADEPDAPAEG